MMERWPDASAGARPTAGRLATSPVGATSLGPPGPSAVAFFPLPEVTESREGHPLKRGVQTSAVSGAYQSCMETVSRMGLPLHKKSGVLKEGELLGSFGDLEARRSCAADVRLPLERIARLR